MILKSLIRFKGLRFKILGYDIVATKGTNVISLFLQGIDLIAHKPIEYVWICDSKLRHEHGKRWKKMVWITLNISLHCYLLGLNKGEE